jgi:putative toxin-antitoxin system antitoxin component (TIGR02293 family)
MSAKRTTYASRLAGLLGRSRDEVRERREWHSSILDGFEFDAVEKIKAHASLTDPELAALLGIGEATLRRARAAGATLDAATSDRLYRLSKVIAIAEEVLEGTANAIGWLRRPQPALTGRVPLDLLVTQAGSDQVETLLRRIDYGVYT